MSSLIGGSPSRRAAPATVPNNGCGTGTTGRPIRRIAAFSEIVPGPATLTVPATGSWTARCSTAIESSSCSTCTRGSKPIITGTTGARSSRVTGLSSVTPMTGCSRSIVHVTSRRRRAMPSTRLSISPRSRWKRVAPGRSAISSERNAGAAGSLP